jgi:deoxyribodipyrimidine photo-lyase
LLPAKWMYYYLLDADWASNACSWQWVCGAFSNKKYFANQENINKFCHTSQKGTFLDVAYEAFEMMPVPHVLEKSVTPELPSVLPENRALDETEFNDVLIYNWYNLDPSWHSDNRFERVLLLEPSVFSKYPISHHSFAFMFDLAKNIPGVKVFVGEFKDLQMLRPHARFIFKEHPLNNYHGLEELRDFIVTDVNGYFRGFFPYWNKISRIIERSW